MDFAGTSGFESLRLTTRYLSGRMSVSCHKGEASRDSTDGELTPDVSRFAGLATTLALLSCPTMTVKNILKTVLPPRTRCWLRRQPLRVQRWFSRDFSLYRRTTPFDKNWGGGRGQIVDRYYIEKFLEENANDVRGHVLEFFDNTYARQFGGAKVTKIDVLHLTSDNPRATIVADLSHGAQIPSDTFDCVICTQVLPFVFSLHAAVNTLYRILKPGGVLLVTSPGIQKISRGDMETSGEYWRFTTLSLRRLFEEAFPRECVQVKASGNVLAATAFLFGLAVEDLRRGDLEFQDPDFPVSIGLRAVKPIARADPAK